MCCNKINKSIKLVCVSYVQNTTFQPIAPVFHVWTLALVVLALPPLTACSVSQVLLRNSMMTDPCKLSYQNEYRIAGNFRDFRDQTPAREN